jgi:hypothetical protein
VSNLLLLFAKMASKVYNNNMNIRAFLVSPLAALAILLGGWFFMLFLIQFTQVPTVSAEDKTVTINYPEAPTLKLADKRLPLLKDYLAQFNSPLVEHAQDFLDAADSYGVDWRLIPAIAGVESTFGKRIPGGHDPQYTTYNGWGWGVYGTHMISFKSWRDAIFQVTKGVKEGYISQGLTNPLTMNKKYASSPVWGEHVNYFLSDMQDYINSHPVSDQFIYEPQDLDSQAVFQNDAYIKVDNDHFVTEYSN